MVIPDQTDTAINLWRFTVYKTSDIGEKKNSGSRDEGTRVSVGYYSLLLLHYWNVFIRPLTHNPVQIKWHRSRRMSIKLNMQLVQDGDGTRGTTSHKRTIVIFSCL